VAGEPIDVSTPNIARVYDYYLGGKDNYAADRAAAQAMIQAAPESVRATKENRRFLVRAADYLAREAGIRQFLDIGSGLPAQQNVHEVVQRAARGDAHVVYVDNDPVVYAHGRVLLATGANTAFVQADLHEPQTILTHPEVTRHIDFDRPVAVLLAAILHFFPDQSNPAGLVAELRSVLAPGSHLVISHVTDHPSTRAIRAVMAKSGGPLWYPRTRPQIARFFDGFTLVDPPGLTAVDRWRTDPETDQAGEPLWCDGAIGVLPVERP
jgi:SAM-dependent methyltransferase